MRAPAVHYKHNTESGIWEDPYKLRECYYFLQPLHLMALPIQEQHLLLSPNFNILPSLLLYHPACSEQSF